MGAILFVILGIRIRHREYALSCKERVFFELGVISLTPAQLPVALQTARLSNAPRRADSILCRNF